MTTTLFFSDVGLRSITEFPGAAKILADALEAEQDRPQSKQQWEILNVLIKMLAAFPSLPTEFISKYPIPKLRELANTMQSDKESRRAMYGFVKLFDHGFVKLSDHGEVTLLLPRKLLRNAIS